MTQMQMITGTAGYLKRLIEKQPAGTLFLKGLLQGQNAGLLDLSGTAEFTQPDRFTILQNAGHIDQGNYLHLFYFNLTEETAPVFEAQVAEILPTISIGDTALRAFIVLRKEANRPIYLVITAWETRMQMILGQHIPEMEALQVFKKRAASEMGTSQVTYQVVDPATIEDPEEAEAEQKRPVTLRDLFKLPKRTKPKQEPETKE